jgi:manganese oxidase
MGGFTRPGTFAILLALTGPTAAAAQHVHAPAQEVRVGAPGAVVYDDYREGAGRMVDGVLHIHLVSHEVEWRPRGERTTALVAHAFSADGGQPQLPAPMIRVPSGTPVEVTVTNGLEKTLVLRGLNDRGAAPPDPGPDPSPLPPHFRDESLRLESGETGTVRFTPTRPGSFIYYGRTLPVYAPEPEEPTSGFLGLPEDAFAGDGPDGPFIGPLVVDPRGSEPPSGEQVMLLTRWADARLDPTTWSVSWRMMMNGRSWPATERLHYTVGDTVRWRVINASLQRHPMHLHGFYFRVDARGNQQGETVFAPEERQLAVTESIVGLGQSARITWVPETPGNWLFHCHLVRHMSPLQRLHGEPELGAHGEGIEDHAHDGMAGMIMGITVRARPGETLKEAPVRRRLELYTGRLDGVFDGDPAYGFVLGKAESPPPVDSVLVPGSMLVLTRGEMTEIVVHNRLDFPFAVHWHGLELASRYDGVADWSGTPGATVPAIAPGSSYAVRIQPPRAGTFMYHVHSEPGHQLAQGMYGPFLVLEAGERYDPDRDRIFVLGAEGTEINSLAPVVNGKPMPEPLELRAGECYRLRFIQISSDDFKRVRLVEGGEPVSWTPLARDGANLPDSLRRPVPAVLTLDVGETRDFLWTPAGAGERTLEITTLFYGASGRAPETIRIPVRVQ